MAHTPRHLVKTSAGKRAGGAKGGRGGGGEEDGVAFGRDADSGRMVIDEEDRPWMEKVWIDKCEM